MSNTYSQILIHLVFAVKGRDSLIHSLWEVRLYKYITGIIQKNEQKLLAISGMPDHIHILIGMKPNCRISDLVREIKKSSTEFIKENNLCRKDFKWQSGYGAFSCSQSSLGNVVKYILNQKEHHRRKSFKDEFMELLDKYEIEHQQRYLFDWIETCTI
ncbi:MAG: IS200/IS605 family transposase [Bacteroidia bacterium]|nr:IS200/IS605 family transposase [Bacteroidota bacterium]MBP6512909.1 IS200/IS605 family transposase [Bacteroidia bacterium]MBP7244611.1 IS200/IS605 family transposase [Bacteroidia bacterium]